jgi:STE24 endopeptidase
MGSEPAASVFEQLLHRFPATVFKLQHSLGLVLLPLLLLFAIRDLGSGQNGSAASTLMAGIAGLVCVVLLYPFYLRFVLPSRPLQPEGELSQYTGWRIRNWNTGETVYNALVTGLLPGFQTVFVSDGLLKHFPSSEVAAIVGHEVAHARRGHLLLRAIAIPGPLLILLGLWVSGLNAVEPLMNSINRMEPTGLVALVAIVAGWAWGVIRPLSHWIEFDADRAAILDPETGKPNPARLNALNSALLRLGYAFPDQFTRRTLLHPSLEQRLGRLNGIRGEIQS